MAENICCTLISLSFRTTSKLYCTSVQYRTSLQYCTSLYCCTSLESRTSLQCCSPWTLASIFGFTHFAGLLDYHHLIANILVEFSTSSFKMRTESIRKSHKAHFNTKRHERNLNVYRCGLCNKSGYTQRYCYSNLESRKSKNRSLRIKQSFNYT